MPTRSSASLMKLYFYTKLYYSINTVCSLLNCTRLNLVLDLLPQEPEATQQQAALQHIELLNTIISHLQHHKIFPLKTWSYSSYAGGASWERG